MINNIKHFQLNKYLISYDEDIDTRIFDDKYCYGIIFSFAEDNSRFELLHNCQMDTERMIISHSHKYNLLESTFLVSEDMPFKPATFPFLPKGVSAKEL
jgi:hypothetical protein